MQIVDQLQTFSDGQGMIENLQNLLNDLTESEILVPIQPVTLLLIDINMPVSDGFETLLRVKKVFEFYNTRLNDRVAAAADASIKPSQSLIIRPFICLFS